MAKCLVIECKERLNEVTKMGSRMPKESQGISKLGFGRSRKSQWCFKTGSQNAERVSTGFSNWDSEYWESFNGVSMLSINMSRKTQWGLNTGFGMWRKSQWGLKTGSQNAERVSTEFKNWD
jgi:hypothetical protein